MTKLYSGLSLIIVLFFSEQSFSQCTCSDGSTPDSLVYNQYVDSMISTSMTLSFPQFDPAVGTLTCFKMGDSVTSIANYNIQNNQDSAIDYEFLSSGTSWITGPGGFSSPIITSTQKHWGPYHLQPKDSVGDSVNVGPDTAFYKNYYETYGSPNAAFYGTGTVNFIYNSASSITFLSKSSNAVFTIQAYTRLYAQLTYYWCPSSVLATTMTNFTAALQNNNVLLQWTVNDIQAGNKYEVEISTDGKDFQTLGQGVAEFSGSLSRYKYLYSPDQNFSGNLFFRIKETNTAGRIDYSEVRTTAINRNGAQYNLYPNPSITGINIQFNNPAGGNYEVDLINAYGQLNFTKKYILNQGGSIKIEWPEKPAAGVYFVRVKDLTRQKEQIERLKIL